MTTAPVIEFPPPVGHGDVRTRLREARELLAGIPGDLTGVMSDELAAVAAEVAGVRAVADAAQAAVVLEASSRGVIAASDRPRPQRWVEQSCREGAVPVTRRAARDLHEVMLTCAGPDAERIRAAVTSGRLPVESAGLVARIYRRLRTSIDYPDWEALAEIVVDWAASGASPSRLRAMEDAVLGQYGTATQLDEKHERHVSSPRHNGPLCTCGTAVARIPAAMPRRGGATGITSATGRSSDPPT